MASLLKTDPLMILHGETYGEQSATNQAGSALRRFPRSPPKQHLQVVLGAERHLCPAHGVPHKTAYDCVRSFSGRLQLSRYCRKVVTALSVTLFLLIISGLFHLILRYLDKVFQHRYQILRCLWIYRRKQRRGQKGSCSRYASFFPSVRRNP